LRSAALRIIRALRIEGGCNVQFALDPESDGYYVIEVNPRVSRSSALASKATGYPIARVAAKIAVGRNLHEISNAVTGKTSAAFEPALDYCVVKIPRWPFDKFPAADRTLGTQMKSTGEVMAIERTFEGALNKALRALEQRPVAATELRGRSDLLHQATDRRLPAALQALRDGLSAEEVSGATGYAPWFPQRLAGMVSLEGRLAAEPLDERLYRRAKQAGLSDASISELINSNPETVSTDFDASSRLYFEPLDLEGVLNVLRREDPVGVLVQFGGQTGLNLADGLAEAGVRLLGSTVDTIDLAEDRRRCDALLGEIGIPRPPGGSAASAEEALAIAARVGYPVVVRPSYVLGGRAMEIVHSA